MDKQEYRTKIDEAQRLIREGDSEEAFYILDGMNWRKVHNVNALLVASEIYENEQRYPQARELLELAHERSPIGRMIIYRLALLCIRLDSLDEAKEYYEEFVEIAPHDSLQYIIQYQLAKAQGAENITLISILEELKEHDFLEEWAYELAVLYHKTGQVEKCISTCDEIILWYGDGPYVESALELKMIYQPLDETQESKYKSFRRGSRDGVTEVRPGEEFGGNGEILSHPIEIPEVALSNDRFNTQNLQAEIKRNIEEIMQATETGAVSENMEAIKELVEDIPYAKIPRESTGPLEEVSIKKEEARRIDDTLRTHFREYLEEEYDGQISFTVPDNVEVEPQIAGQMTIDRSCRTGSGQRARQSMHCPRRMSFAWRMPRQKRSKRRTRSLPAWKRQSVSWMPACRREIFCAMNIWQTSRRRERSWQSGLRRCGSSLAESRQIKTSAHCRPVWIRKTGADLLLPEMMPAERRVWLLRVNQGYRASPCGV